MQHGYQTHGISYWDHGSIVAARFKDLMSPTPAMEYQLPQWYTENKDFIKAALIPKMDDICTYQLWHDLGKPYCRTVDEDGKIHYPNHADISAEIWEHLGGDREIGQLIRDDMLCHQLRTSDAEAFASNPNALILLVTALCELHANATMFGGYQSDSFKIKYKRLSKCGAIILKTLKG